MGVLENLHTGLENGRKRAKEPTDVRFRLSELHHTSYDLYDETDPNSAGIVDIGTPFDSLISHFTTDASGTPDDTTSEQETLANDSSEPQPTASTAEPVTSANEVTEPHPIPAASNPAPSPTNTLTLGDNLAYMKWLLANGYEGQFRVIYIDPPFFTKGTYDATITLRSEDGKSHKIKHLAYDDTFDRSLECYAENMTARLILMKQLLADDGLIWVHLDWHSCSYVKILMDEIFGAKNFQNEIIWQYKSGGSGTKHFARKHDTILVYSKAANFRLHVPKEKSYNRDFKPYRFKGVTEYQDEIGWYTMVNMKDIWPIDMVGRTSKERNGYATQKPLELMRRIITSSTEEGDLCGDFFCGSGSFLEAANELNRRWIGCDSEALAVSVTRRRMDEIRASYTCYRDPWESIPGTFEMEEVTAVPMRDGRKLITARVRAFNPEIEYGHIPLKDRDVAAHIGETSPLRYLDYLMVDPEYNGQFTSRMICPGDAPQIQFPTGGSYAIIAVDVFGKEYWYGKEPQER